MPLMFQAPTGLPPQSPCTPQPPSAPLPLHPAIPRTPAPTTAESRTSFAPVFITASHLLLESEHHRAQPLQVGQGAPIGTGELQDLVRRAHRRLERVRRRL